MRSLCSKISKLVDNYKVFVDLILLDTLLILLVLATTIDSGVLHVSATMYLFLVLIYVYNSVNKRN